jgi:hypothetical protein
MSNAWLCSWLTHEPAVIATNPAADMTVERIGYLLTMNLATLLTGAIT